jgi:hypothetical protein
MKTPSVGFAILLALASCRTEQGQATGGQGGASATGGQAGMSATGGQAGANPTGGQPGGLTSADAGPRPGDAGAAQDAPLDGPQGQDAAATRPCDAGAGCRCGGPGEACCEGAPRCRDGTVCDNRGRGTCAVCGGQSQICCEGSVCNGGCCSGGLCVADGASCTVPGQQGIFGTCKAGSCGCGGVGQPCCVGDTCQGTDTVCFWEHKTCELCGTKDAPCCKNNVCNQAGTACEPNSQDRCRECGLTEVGCCPGNTCKSAGDVCVNGLCKKCGVRGGPCCPGGTCPNGGCCTQNICVDHYDPCLGKDPGYCDAGKCQCGMAGQPCCRVDSPACTEPNTACTDPVGLTSTEFRCQKCGGVGQPCCPGSRCNGSACCAHPYPYVGQIHVATCVAQGASCGRPELVCGTGGRCSQTCGGLDQPCCDNTIFENFCTAAGTHCFAVTSGNDARCLACGGLSQFCCPYVSSNLDNSSTDFCTGTLKCGGSSYRPVCGLP